MSTIAMPAPDADIIARKDEIVAALAAVLPADAVIFDPEETRAYECDALTAYACAPLCVVLPTSTEQVAAIVRIANDLKIPVVPRDGGTGLTDGAVPLRRAPRRRSRT